MLETHQLEMRLAATTEILEGFKPIHPVGAAVFFRSNHTADITVYVEESTDKSTWTQITSGTVVAKGWLYKFIQSTSKYVRFRIGADASEGIRIELAQPAESEMYQDLLNA